MFDNQLKTFKRGEKCCGTIVIGGVVVAVAEPTFEAMMQGIVSAVEFFPLQQVIGKESFAKAVELFVTTKKGTDAQKAVAFEKIEQILSNARKNSDPTAQDIDYALARLSRSYRRNKLNIAGDFAFDALGFSPSNLKANLDQLAKNSPALSEAKRLFNDLTGRDNKKREAARHRLRVIKERADNGDTVVGRAVVAGVQQYIKANNAKALREELFGDENITVGFSFKKMLKKVAKTALIPPGLEQTIKAGKALKKGNLKAFAKAAFVPPGAMQTLNAAKALKSGNIKKFAKMALIPSDVREAVDAGRSKPKPKPKAKPAAKPKPALRAAMQIQRNGNTSPRATEALALTASAKDGDKEAAETIKAINAEAKAGNPEAQETMQTIKSADMAIEEQSEALDQDTNADDFETQQGDQSFAEDMEDEVISGMLEDELGFSLKSVLKKAKSVAKIASKVAMPLAATAANMFAPGLGTALSKAVPALIDAIPKDVRPLAGDIAKAMTVVKAADEMNPKAKAEIETIKKMADQGVPKAVVALNALKVAKSTQKVAEGMVAANSETAQKVEKLANESFAKDSAASAFQSKNGEPIPVRIVAWGK